VSGDIEQLAAAMGPERHAVALTGAGVSTGSGIPDFRGEGGIWEQFDPAEFRYDRFRRDPAGFWERRIEMQAAVYGGDVEPNPAHDALAALEARGVLDTLLTQNVDGLHAAAGSETVVELHGNASRVVCERGDTRQPFDPVRVANGDLPPRCGDCDGLLRPDVVLFGEQLPGQALRRARETTRDADVFLAVGSSLTVDPVASLPRLARRHGATLAVLNLESTPVSDLADYDLRRDVTAVLPRLVEAATAP
jgi:NAD-dependent deacetylase